MCVLLEDREADVRQKTVQLLTELTDERGEITAAVAERLVDSNTCVRQTALHALVTLAGKEDTRILSAVCLLLKAGKDPSEALKQLADAGDQNATVAADVLVTTTNLPARNVHELISFCALLRDENQAVRYMAIVTLAQVSPDEPENPGVAVSLCRSYFLYICLSVSSSLSVRLHVPVCLPPISVHLSLLSCLCPCLCHFFFSASLCLCLFFVLSPCLCLCVSSSP